MFFFFKKQNKTTKTKLTWLLSNISEVGTQNCMFISVTKNSSDNFYLMIRSAYCCKIKYNTWNSGLLQLNDSITLHSGLIPSQKQSISAVNGKKEFYRVPLKGFQNTTTKWLSCLYKLFYLF